MSNELYIQQRNGSNGPFVLRKITPSAGGGLSFDANKKLVTTAGAQVTSYALSGALTVSHGLHKITKATAAAMTLVPPTAAQEGTVMRITSQTAAVHTVTLTEGFNAGGASTDVATFGGAIGDSMEVVAVNAHWNVNVLRNVTLA